jgi:hypothetical protein
MATNAYMAGRKKYQRPQGILFADNEGIKVDGFHIPEGDEIGSLGASVDGYGEFLILSDNNRSPIDFKTTRIEKRERMINGRMRSYHTADKLTLTVSWDMLPSRAFDTYAGFDANGNPNMAIIPEIRTNPLEFTTDGGAGGVELLDWYKNHSGSFWVYLAYDKYTNFKDVFETVNVDERFNNTNKYNEVIEMFFSDFSYSVQKRSGLNFDFWNVSLTLEEA